MFKIYGKQGCSACLQAKALLESNEIPFQYLSLGKDYSLQEFMKIKLGWKSFPLITEVLESCTLEEFESPIGGLDDLKAYLDK